MAEVVIAELSKVFPGGSVALDHVDLTVADGEFLVLVGPSGCGKSTLLRVVAGLEDPTEGTVSIGGKIVNDLPPKARDIAMVFQNYALYPHMNVAENMAFSLKISHTPRDDIRRQVHEVAETLALEPLLERKPKALSGGQRQRVAMGRAMVRRPKVFLMDEPLSNLDAKLRVAMRGELIRLHQESGTTTIYVTHDQVEAMTLGDRIAVLNEGRLQQVGTPDELYRHPVNVFVAGFIGSPAMNLAHARIESVGDAVELIVGDHRWLVPEAVLNRLPDLRHLSGHRVVVGLRPGALGLLGPVDDIDVPRISVAAVSVESLGDEKNVLFLPPFEVPEVVARHNETETELTSMWTARVEPDAAVFTGQEVTLRLDLAQAYFFDADSGQAFASEASARADGTLVP
ncbi:MAG: ABC transporter ATP-binding protein [Hamadaea sp.]|uniref:ABC transporter ATP-binding protein n=1 Tax=Hamadaea sp. TaxID=2024425 RepID=UPI00181BC39D|nr:ABC transporter ATP-binding protein [Hamadaea sp.]NUT18893.1 ABC transporter ATP-binding protein [Hamadaea sp.]